MEYKSLKNQVFKSGQYNLVPLRKEDIFLIKDWRNAQVNVLRQNGVLTDEDQRNYFEQIIIPLFSKEKPNQIIFSFLFDDQCIGYGGLTNIDWFSLRAEVSFLVDPIRTKDSNIYTKEFGTFLSLLKEVAFQDLEFNRLYTETFDIRPIHISILEKNGFVIEGRMKEHVMIDGEFIDSLIHGCVKGK